MPEKEIAKVAKMMDDNGLMEITSESSILFGLVKQKIHLSKQEICITNAATGAGTNVDKSAKAPENARSAAGSAGAITSPMVGVVYLAPEPTAKPFAAVGKKVSAGETLCLIEAMKTFNPIKAPKDGIVGEILVADGETVEYGTPLIVIK